MFEESTLKKILEDGPEAMIYFIIQELGGFCWRMNHEIAHDRIPEKDVPAIDADIAKARQEQVLAVKSLTRFGLTQPLDESDRPTADYWKWYRWWNDYINALSDEEFKKLDKAMTNKEDLSSWRPQGSWQG